MTLIFHQRFQHFDYPALFKSVGNTIPSIINIQQGIQTICTQTDRRTNFLGGWV